MLMEEDRESQLQRKGVLKLLLPLFILWVLCVTSAVVTYTFGDGEFNTAISNASFNSPSSRITLFSAVNNIRSHSFGEYVKCHNSNFASFCLPLLLQI